MWQQQQQQQQSSVNKNNSNTSFCSELSTFLKPFSINYDWRMLSVTTTICDNNNKTNLWVKHQACDNINSL